MFNSFSAPLSVYLGVTNECNLTCVYCSAESGEKYHNELSLEEMYSLIGELQQAKVFHVTITGGEPFLRKDIFQIFERLLQSNISISLITNATLVNDRIAQRLHSLGIKDIKVSLDATSPEANDAGRGKAAFVRAYRGIKILLQNGIRPAILVTISNLNYKLIQNIADDLKEIDVQWVAFNMISAVGRGVCSFPVLNLSKDQIEEFVSLLRSVKSEHKGFVKEDILHWLDLPEQTRRLMQKYTDGVEQLQQTMLPCGAAKTACSITADGWVIPCNKFTGYRCGNIRDSSFLEIWKNERMENIRSLAKKPTSTAHGCSSCGYSVRCAGGCRAEAYLHFGDLEAPDPGCEILPDSGIHAYKKNQTLVQITVGTIGS